MNEKTMIKTTKVIYPQIYAYTIPNLKEDNGWIKIGYTERENVDERIAEQTHTAAFNFDYDKLWSNPAKFRNKDQWFKDKELHAYLREFKDVEQRKNTEWFYYDGHPEKSYTDFIDFTDDVKDQSLEHIQYELRNEQKDAVDKTIAYFKNHSDSEFLWNAKPRFGKTLTTYALARKLKANNVLVVTNRPAIANSWFDDFQKFIAWQTKYKFVSTSDSLNGRPVLKRKDFVTESLNDNNLKQIAFISLQDLKGSKYFGGGYDKLEWVKDLNWDLLVVDESHEGVDTLKTDVAFENIKRTNTLHLSGTPFKEVASGKLSDDQIFNWTYADEQNAKKNWLDVEKNNPYENMPKLNLFSYQMSNMITEEVNTGANIDGENIDYAFDLNEFFETNDNGKFIHEDDVNKWLTSLTLDNDTNKYPFSTPKLRDELKHTFWLLNRVSSAKALKKLLQKNSVFKEYHIILAAGDGKDDSNDSDNRKSLDKVKSAVKKYEKTITLSVGQLTTGVTIPEWSAVMMLSNMKSPSIYMQAAFRAQNPWSFEENGKCHQKKNAYVFDFAPERTLTIYDEFANNLSENTSNGKGTSDERKNNIKKLLNFFPVIAEDSMGEMTPLNVSQVLSIPKEIKATEVVKRGFMSNLLFKNIAGVFSSAGAREILDQLKPVDNGKTMSHKSDKKIDPNEISVDKNGEVQINPEIVVSTTDANFGQKFYSAIDEKTANIFDDEENFKNQIVNTFKENTNKATENLAIENGVSRTQANKIINNEAKVIARTVEIEQYRANIRLTEAESSIKREISNSHYDDKKVKDIEKNYEIKKNEIKKESEEKLKSEIASKVKKAAQRTTEKFLKKDVDRKKKSVEDDVRARLRGFSRTIPSFLMAYGSNDITLSNFDTYISRNVFKEVTGITIDQFKILRDKYNFFDEEVFNESVREFMNKRNELANYFDDNDEDIFDYIPAQKTNQIFTPKKVVKLMVDKLQKESPEDFKNPDKTFADLYIKSGLYLAEIVKRLYVGLKEKIPDDNQRLKHILENQVYGFAPTEIIYNIAKNFIFGFDEDLNKINKSHIVNLDTTPFAKGQGDFEKKCDELFK